MVTFGEIWNEEKQRSTDMIKNRVEYITDAYMTLEMLSPGHFDKSFLAWQPGLDRKLSDQNICFTQLLGYFCFEDEDVSLYCLLNGPTDFMSFRTMLEKIHNDLRDWSAQALHCVSEMHTLYKHRYQLGFDPRGGSSS